MELALKNRQKLTSELNVTVNKHKNISDELEERFARDSPILRLFFQQQLLKLQDKAETMSAQRAAQLKHSAIPKKLLKTKFSIMLSK